MGNANQKLEEEANAARDAEISATIYKVYENSEKARIRLRTSCKILKKIYDIRGYDYHSSRYVSEKVFKEYLQYDSDEDVKEYPPTWVSLQMEGSENESVLHSLKKGVEFLGKLCTFSTSSHLDKITWQSYTVDVEENEDWRRIMMIIVNIITNNDEYSKIFKKVDLTDNYGSIIDLLLENILEVKCIWYNNRNATSDDQTAALDEKIGELRVIQTYLKPLYVCLAHSSHLVQMPTSLDSIIIHAAVVIYLLFVDKMDKQIVVHMLTLIVSDLKEIGPNIYNKFLEFRTLELTSDMEGWLYILDNLIHILATNSAYLNEPNQYLYKELMELRTFVGGRVMLNHYCGIKKSAESICYQAVQIVSTIYVEEDILEVYHILVSVLDQIKKFKLHSSQEIRLHEYPRVDGLGFLEFFLGRLKELQGQKKMSVMMSEIEALHFDFNFLLSSTKRSEEKLISGSHIVKLAYQAEYVIDLYLVLPDSRCISTLSHIVQEVKEIKEKVLALPDKCLHVEELKENKEKVLVLPDKSLDVEDVVLHTPKTVHGTPLHVDNEIVGFQEETVAIMNDLLAGESDLKVISIVGMAGAGKTSLAKHLFKECSHDGHFDKTAWCTVSQTYQLKDLLLIILKQIDPSKIKEEMDYQAFADELCKSLRRRRYLVVIDDVWDISVWNDLSRYFKDDRNKSRILITTRLHNVASGTKSNIHELRPLTEDESWELLQKKLSREESLPEYNESIAKEVTKSCKGLPLSIVIIGSLLHHATNDEEMWNQIAKDVTSTILSDPGGECKAILELSYNHLPDNLKACFLYLGVFPEDHEISVTRLVWLWVAEGLVRGMTDSDVCVEDIGKRYVDDLIKRSLIIPIKEKTVGGVKTVQLHDLLRDFSLEKAKDENFFTVIYKGISDLPPCPRRIRINGGNDTHLSLKEKRKNQKNKWSSSLSQNNVRTIICFDKSSGIESIVRSEHMLLLNVLEMAVLDESASYYLHRYVHLKYLAVWSLRCSSMKFFKQSLISKLLNLEVLIVCSLKLLGEKDIVVPDVIWDLVKLRHIDIRDNVRFPNHSEKIKDSTVILENLMSLSEASLYYRDSDWLRKLPKLQKLRCIFFPSYDSSLKQYRFPELDHCNRLTSLYIGYGNEDHFPNLSDISRRCKLHLPASLRKLSLSKLNLNADDLSEIGKSLPNLEVFKLHHNYMDKWSVEDEDFPNLKVLEVTDYGYSGLNVWDASENSFFDEWDASENSFPKLEQLRLRGCRKLEEIPLCFGEIPNLRLIYIEYCKLSLHESARKIKKIQDEAQNLELKLYILERESKVAELIGILTEGVAKLIGILTEGGAAGVISILREGGAAGVISILTAILYGGASACICFLILMLQRLAKTVWRCFWRCFCF